MTLYPSKTIYPPIAQIYAGDTHDTYLNGARYGWPVDHTAEDTFALPPPPLPAAGEHTDSEYIAEMVLGIATVSLVTRRELGKYYTLADAHLAAEALNNHKGY